MARDGRRAFRTQHEMLAQFVEGQEIQGRQSEADEAQRPEWRARLQNHGADADFAIAQLGLDELAIFMPAALDVIGNPFARGRRKLGDDVQRKIGKNVF